MYASKALIALALAGAAIPAFAQSFEPLAAREELSLVARNVNFVRSVGESLGMKRSEIEDILARELHHGAKQHKSHPGSKHHARASTATTQPKAAHKAGGSTAATQPKTAHKAGGEHRGPKRHGAKHGPKGAKPAHTARALLARQGTVDQSGAFSFSDFLKDAGTVVSAILRREDMEMLARADASGAFSFSDFLKDAGTVVSAILRREDIEMLARAEESGAFSFSDFLKDAGTVVSAILRRENLEMLARADTESGAFNFGGFLKDVASAILRREEEMMARSINDLD